MSPTGPRLLLVEDEPGLAVTLSDLLASEGYRVEQAATGPDGFQAASSGEYAAIVLDLMLPGRSGLDVCRDLRQRGVATPILMLTARGQLSDKVAGLKLGADDYLTKPFEAPELLARLEALLRRAQAGASPARPAGEFQFGAVRVDFRGAEVRRHGLPVELSPREFALLRFFVQNRGAALSRGELLQEVWGYDSGMLTRTVDVHVNLLRQKLEEKAHHPRHFLTVRGLGYKFVDSPD